MMHSSLSHCGYFKGGPSFIVNAIRARCDTLCLPTHTYCYPAANGDAPIFDPLKTESVVGAITNYFWKNTPGVERSLHPSHSLAGVGVQAKELTANHERCHTPCGTGTPYERLVQQDAAVIMFGVTMNAYTFFHTAENDAGCPYLYEPRQYLLRAKDRAGHLLDVPTWRQDMSVRRRFAEMDDVLQSEGLLRRILLGKGEILFIPSSKQVHDFLIDILRSNKTYLVAARLDGGVRN